MNITGPGLARQRCHACLSRALDEMRHDSFVHVTRLIHICDMTRSHVWRGSLLGQFAKSDLRFERDMICERNDWWEIWFVRDMICERHIWMSHVTCTNESCLISSSARLRHDLWEIYIQHKSTISATVVTVVVLSYFKMQCDAVCCSVLQCPIQQWRRRQESPQYRSAKTHSMLYVVGHFSQMMHYYGNLLQKPYGDQASYQNLPPCTGVADYRILWSTGSSRHLNGVAFITAWKIVQ